MFKVLMFRKDCGGFSLQSAASPARRLKAVVLGLLLAGFPLPAEASRCMSPSYVVVPCSNPAATICEPTPGPNDCAAQGYTMWMGADGDPWYCANPTCTYHPPTPAGCTFNGQAVSHGTSVTAYAASSVPFGQTCQSQTRTCTNGTLSGTYTAATCSVAPAANCTFNGNTVNHGSGVTAYQTASVPYGQACAGEARSCSNGTLSGSYPEASCSISPPADCDFNGTPVSHASGVTAYQSNEVPAGETCQSETRTCTNGSLSGSYTYPACTVSFSLGATVQ